jgi:hypothetical protein
VSAARGLAYLVESENGELEIRASSPRQAAITAAAALELPSLSVVRVIRLGEPAPGLYARRAYVVAIKREGGERVASWLPL